MFLWVFEVFFYLCLFFVCLNTFLCFFTECHAKLFSAGTNGGVVTVKLVVLEQCGTWDRTIARKSTVTALT